MDVDPRAFRLGCIALPVGDFQLLHVAARCRRVGVHEATCSLITRLL